MGAMMKRSLPAMIAAAALLAASQASGQTELVELTPEQRLKIRDYVIEKRMRPVLLGRRVDVGATLPGDVETVAVPDSWGASLRKYRYVYLGDQLVFIEPRTREIVQVID
jgi:hypothetical protein